jgi:hypothetical protein
MRERRKETRYFVHEIYQKYVTFKIRKGSEEFLLVELLDFSPSGIKIRTPFSLMVDSSIECLISIPKSITKEIPFVGKIKYCIQGETKEEYLTGVEIIQTSAPIWFDVFSKTHDFIKERIGGIFK